MLRLLNVLRNPGYAGLSLLAGIAMLAIYVYAQILGIIQNIDVWFASVPLFNLILTIIFSLLFGITLSYQISLWRRPATCSLDKRVAGSGTMGVGTIGAFLVAQCPACASLGTLFLPLSAIGFFAKYGVYITLLSITLLVFTLNYLGAFKHE